MDEGTHLAEDSIFWINSRLRNSSSSIENKSFWISCNPDGDSWLLDWVRWYIYPEEAGDKAGLPNPERNGVERYIGRVAGKTVFADTEEEFISKYFDPALSVDDPSQPAPLTLTVLLGNVYDNPVLVKKQPQYVANLRSMPEVEMRRNLLGDWFARAQNSSMFSRGWVEEVDDIDPALIVSTVRAYDLAGTLSSDVTPHPDYTACVKMSKLTDGRYIIRDVQRTRITVGNWLNFIRDNAIRDRENGEFVTILLPIDPNPSAKLGIQMLSYELNDAGFVVKLEAQHFKKLEAFRPFASRAENGGILVIKDCGNDFDSENYYTNDFWYKELEDFTGEKTRVRTVKDDRQTCRL